MRKLARDLAMAWTLVLATASPARCEQVGAWTLEIDPMSEVLGQLRTQVAASGASFTIEASSFDITYEGNVQLSDQQKLAIHARWSNVMLDALKASGLRPMDGPGITPAQREQLANLRQTMIDRLPFGMRAQMREHVGDIAMLMDETSAPCTRIDGAYGGMVMPMHPRAGVGSDFGSIAVFVFGMGSCGVRGEYAERRLGYTFDRAKRALFRELTARGADR